MEGVVKVTEGCQTAGIEPFILSKLSDRCSRSCPSVAISSHVVRLFGAAPRGSDEVNMTSN